MYLDLEDGTQLHYEVDGEPGRPALLLWHGARCTLRQWDHVVPMLKDTFFLIRFDIRGAGQSKAVEDTDYSLAIYATDACRLLDQMAVDHCHVWSMAWGSRAALAFCAYHPERVRSASLYDLSIGTADVQAQQQGSREARRRLAAKGYHVPSLPEGWNRHLDDATLTQSLAAAGRADLAELATRITAPVLIATGDHDPNLISSRAAAEIIPDAQLVELVDIGHGSVLMHPDLCVEVLTEFITKHS